MRWLTFILATLAFAALAFLVWAVSVFGDCFDEACRRAVTDRVHFEGWVVLIAYTALCAWRVRSWTAIGTKGIWAIGGLWIVAAILTWWLFFRFNY